MTENGAKGAAAEARSNAAVKGSVSSTGVLVVAEQDLLLAQQNKQYRNQEYQKSCRVHKEVTKKTISRILHRINELSEYMKTPNDQESDGIEEIAELTTEINKLESRLNDLESEIVTLKTQFDQLQQILGKYPDDDSIKKTTL